MPDSVDLNFSRDSKKCPFSKIGLRGQSIKAGKTLSLHWKELNICCGQTILFLKKRKRKLKWGRKKIKSTTKLNAPAFFVLSHSFLHLKPIQSTD